MEITQDHFIIMWGSPKGEATQELTVSAFDDAFEYEKELESILDMVSVEEVTVLTLNSSGELIAVVLMRDGERVFE